jgi:hypothetical protein
MSQRSEAPGPIDVRQQLSHRAAASRWVYCPVNTPTHSSYFSDGDNRRRVLRAESTLESDIIDNLRTRQARRPLAGYFTPILVHSVRRKTVTCDVSGTRHRKPSVRFHHLAPISKQPANSRPPTRPGTWDGVPHDSIPNVPVPPTGQMSPDLLAAPLDQMDPGRIVTILTRWSLTRSPMKSRGMNRNRVAVVLNRMDSGRAAAVLDRMDPDRAAGALKVMNDSLAVLISTE